MGEIIKLTAALVVISMVIGLAVAVTNNKTKDRIKEQQLHIQQSAVEAVFPSGVAISEHEGDGGLPYKYWSASDNGELIGYAFKITGQGYAGDILFMISADTAGKILGMTVLEHNETPGLGSRVTEVASNKYIWYPVGSSEKVKPWFTEQFEGLSCFKPIGIDKSGEWHKFDAQRRAQLQSRNTVTAITGSTITTAAFTKSIERKAAVYVASLKEKYLEK
ncbi:MAG: FMN-binding protein [Chitinispirillales bacterium]|nr:FMN-binding protein [Chitinispirillales bacterium]